MATSSDSQSSVLKEWYGGLLTEQEMGFLDGVKQSLSSVLEHRKGFGLAVKKIAKELSEIIQTEFTTPLGQYSDMHMFLEKFADGVPSLTVAGDEITDHEEMFIKDVIGVIDFAVRNGIGYGMMVGVLAHDIREIYLHGSLDRALERGFRPKASGWSEYSLDSIGDPDESTE